MKILGIGTDLVKVSRVEHLWNHYGVKFSSRILSEIEQDRLKLNINPVLFLSKCFAVKEAAVKALGTGFRFGILFEDLTLEKTALGKPEISLTGATAEQAKKLGVKHIHISLSDEVDYVVAFVIMSG